MKQAKEQHRGGQVDKQEFDAVMQRLAGVYPGRLTTNQQRVEMQRVLSPFTARAVNRAVDTWVEKSEWHPKPSQLLSLIDKGPRSYTQDCKVCDGSGWMETTSPLLDQDGNAAVGSEQPWVYKCEACDGSGRS
jgi:hypothetical protein